VSTYEPGAVAVATVCGVPNVRVMRGADSHGPKPLEWCASRAVNGNWWFIDEEVTDVRPLVVLDLDDPEFTVAALRDTLPECARDHDRLNVEVLRLARQIEAQTKPPRIPEPGLWGVVEDCRGQQYVRIDTAEGVSDAWRWQGLGHESHRGNEYARWADIENPTLVRPGIEDAS